MATTSLDELARKIAEHGLTDVEYLELHWPRFRTTKDTFEAGRNGVGKRLLDVGAHWLHQAMLFALDGYAVTAVDLSDTLDIPSIISLARTYNIRLICCDNLEVPTALSILPDGSFDVVFLGETIEHITFNPVRFWTEVYRLLSPGGRIVITTPNYYAATRLHLEQGWRVLTGRGGGISVEKILATPTYGHHWKEYSKWELEQYFKLLSPDFRIYRSLYVSDVARSQSMAKFVLHAAQRMIPLLRPRLHVEIDLPKKSQGITAIPRWD